MRFEGKVALVTGGSSGMGAATAQLLADGGARVFCAQRGHSAHEDINANFSDPDAPEHVISKISARASQREILINSMSDPAKFRNEIGSIHPVRRTGAPEEVAKLICWLASNEASFVTGQIWTIDGGRMAQLSLP